MLSWAVLIFAVLATAPMKLDMRINLSSSFSFRCEVSLYLVKIRFGGLMDRRFLAGNGKSPLSFPQIVLLLKSIYKRSCQKRVEIFCRIGTGDARLTAMAVGGVQVLLGCLRRPKIKVCVAADLQNAVLEASGRCILHFRGGDIIITGMRAAGARLPKMMKGLNGNGKTKHREPDGHDDGEHQGDGGC